MKLMSRVSDRTGIRAVGKEVSRMTKSLTYVGVLVLVAGVLLTTCSTNAWSMELLTEEEMAVVRGTDCQLWGCRDTGYCAPPCAKAGSICQKFTQRGMESECYSIENGALGCDNVDSLTFEPPVVCCMKQYCNGTLPDCTTCTDCSGEATACSNGYQVCVLTVP